MVQPPSFRGYYAIAADRMAPEQVEDLNRAFRELGIEYQQEFNPARAFLDVVIPEENMTDQDDKLAGFLLYHGIPFAWARRHTKALAEKLRDYFAGLLPAEQADVQVTTEPMYVEMYRRHPKLLGDKSAFFWDPPSRWAWISTEDSLLELERPSGPRFAPNNRALQ